jgi:LAS superfamily LD-carboxypeptidase LdcB
MRTRIAATDAAPNGEIPTVLLCGVTFARTALLRCDAATMLEQMDAAYHQETGRHLVISSSYRTTAEQEVLRATKGELAAVAGTSNHGRALAIDLTGAGELGQFDAPVYQWLVANAATYGWHHPAYMEPGGAGPLEPWHWEYGTD